MWQINIGAVDANNDFEPYSIKPDEEIKKNLNSKNISYSLFEDHVIFEKHEIIKENGEPYKVFSLYINRWVIKLHNTKLTEYTTEGL